ncbi:MAG: hypothetical protein OXE05_10520 [Chloroflexi bacterium]|nr:hypothetical protein [Chloroflexota bacterium]
MPARIMAATHVGLDSAQVEVGVDCADGLPITVVGGVPAGWVWGLIVQPGDARAESAKSKGPALPASNQPCEHGEHGMHGSELRVSRSLPGFSSLPGALSAGAIGRMSCPPV